MELVSDKCIVKRRDNVVVVWPIYVLLILEKQSPIGHVNSYTTLVSFRRVVFGDELLKVTRFAVLNFL